ncbi:MAG: hypothetical protein ACKVXR_02950 [Planctomycetota bacterium]
MSAKFLAAVLAFALQDPPAAEPPDPSVLDALVRKTNLLTAFVAEYEASGTGKESATLVRILYRAPGDAKIVLGAEGIFRIHDGFLDVRIDRPGEPPVAARVELEQPMVQRSARLAAAMRAEFPVADESKRPEGSPGVRFDLSMSSTPDSKSLQFTASYSRSNPVLLGWLQDLASERATPGVGDRLVFADPFGSEGIRYTLSTDSGFIEKVESSLAGATSSFTLVKLDLAPKLANADFDLPARPADSVDASASFAERFHEIQTQLIRADVFRRVAQLVASKEIAWDQPARERLARVLDVVHADAWRLENEVWVSEMRRRMDEFSGWLREKLRDPELVDEASRKKLEDSVVEWRRALPASAAAGIDERFARLQIEAKVVEDEAMRKDFREIERAAVWKTMQSALVEPLLREFDQKIEQARLGK